MTERPYQNSPKVHLPLTPEGGHLTVTATGNGHVYVSTDPTQAHLLVRGVAYRVNAYLERLPDGSFGFRVDQHGREDRSMLSITRAEAGRRQDPVSEPARRAIRERLLQLVPAFLADHPDLLVQGDRAARSNEARRIEAGLAEALATVARLTQQLEDLYAQDASLTDDAAQVVRATPS